MFHFRSTLFLESFLLGGFTLLIGTSLFQSIMSSTGGKEFILAAIAAPILLISAFISLLPVLPHRRKDCFEPLYLFAAAAVTVFILVLLLGTSILFSFDLRKNLIREASGELLFGIYLITTVSSGVAFGILYGTFFCWAKHLEENRTHVFGVLCGICAGGGVFLLLAALHATMMTILKTTFFSAALFLFCNLCSALSALPVARRKRIALFLVFLGGGILFFQETLLFAEQRLKPFSRISLNAPTGRYEFSTFGIFHNGKLWRKKNSTPESEKLNVLFPVLQKSRTSQKVAVISSLNTWLLYALRSMPNVESVDVCLPDPVLLSAASALNTQRDKLHFHLHDPMRYFAGRKGTYDLFLIGITDIYSLGMHRYHTAEMIETARRSLKPDGVFAILLPEPEGYAQEAVEELQASIIATVKRVFPNVLFAAGRSDILLASTRKALTLSPEILAERARELFGNSLRIPPGLFLATGNLLFDPAETEKILALSETKTGNRAFYPETVLLSWKNSPFLSSPLFQHILSVHRFCTDHALLLLFCLAGLYLPLRYLRSSSVDRRGLFLSFENGFYTLGTLAMILYLLQIRTGTLYGSLPLLMVLLAGGGITGALLSRWKTISRPLYLLAALLPPAVALFLILPKESPTISMMCAIFATGLFSGYAYFHVRELCGEREYANFLPSMLLLGGGVGFLIAAFLLLPSSSGGLLLCVVLLAATRATRAVRG